MSAPSNASTNHSSMQPMDVMIEDIHSRCAMMDTQCCAITTQLRDHCEGFINTATDKAKTIVEEAEKRAEAMCDEIAKWEEEKRTIAATHPFDPKIKLDVGGHSFTTTLTTLTRFPDTMLGAMFSGRHALVKDECGAYFIDRDGTHFREILNFLRAPEAYKQAAPQEKGDLSEVEIEADYYGLKDLMFPIPTPPSFVKAAPVTITTPGGQAAVVSQDDAGLWYFCIPPGLNYPKVVSVCDTCGSGSTGIVPSRHFTTGRAITAAQPRKTCQNC